MNLHTTLLFPGLALVAACADASKPDPTTPPTDPTPVVSLDDHGTPLCAPGPLTGTLPAGTGTTDATLTLPGRSTDLVLDPSSDGAFTIDPALLPLDDVCTPSQAPCTLEATLTVTLDGQSLSDAATLTLTDDGVFVAYLDADGDGYGADDALGEPVCDATGYAERQGDCDDTLDSVHAGIAADGCNGIDDDCDGTDDEDALFVDYHPDLDGDGFGALGSVPEPRCDVPDASEGLAPDASDCSDDPSLDANAASTFPGASELCDGFDNDCDGGVDDHDPEGPDDGVYQFLDEDGDGAFPDQATFGCPAPGVEGVDFLLSAPAAAEADCDDTDALSFPGATDTPGDDVDQDCDADFACFVDADGDGYGTGLTADVPSACSAAPGASPFASDCDDDVATGSQRSPGHPEVPGNSIDEDCSLSYACYLDADDDGFAAPGAALVDGPQPCDLVPGGAGAATPTTLGVDIDCNDASTAFAPGSDDSAVGDPDYDCDGLVTCYVDADDDDFGVHVTTESSVFPGEVSNCDVAANVAPVLGDCNEADPFAFPGAEEIPCDGLVQDCLRDEDASVVLLAGSFTPADLYFDGADPQTQLTAALSASLAGDTVRLCHGEVYLGSFEIRRPITLEGDGATLRGGYVQPQPEDCLAPDDASVLYVSSPGTTVLRDLTIRGGCSDGSGGGLHVAGISNVEATNLVLTENASVVYGGGVAVTETATLDWIGGALTDNHCDNGGGAFVGLDATLHVAGDAETFLIDGNTGFIGGAIRASGDLTVTDTTLSNNSATSYGGAVYAFGHVDFLRSDLVNNWSATSGGGIYTLGTATFVDTNISGNQAVSHGGGAFVDGTAEFVGSTLDSNDGGSQGGAVYVYPTGAVDLVDSALTHNSATTGGAVLSKGVVAFDQVSLSDNTATDGSSVALVGESAVFTYTIAPGGNGDPTPNIYCDTSGNTYATTDPYTSCDDVLCYP